MDINQNNLCYGCMNKLESNIEKCDKCGHINGSVQGDSYLLEGTVIHSRYVIGKVLGHGGFGITYIAYDTRIDSVVAIKEYLPGDFSIRIQNKPDVLIYDGEKKEQFQQGLEKFLEEAKTMAKYNHYKGVVTTKDFIQENGTAYIVMEYLDGETVEEYLSRNEGSIGYYKMLEIMYPVMESLILLHQDGIIHRDISPDNIYMTKDNKIKLIDFGAARESLNEVKNYSIVLKPGYAPEEQYRSKGIQGPFTDVYALAATMYKMLTGVTPVESMERVLGDKELQPLSDFNLKISKKQISIIEKGLAVNSSDRYQTVSDFKKALEKSSTKANETLSVIRNIAVLLVVLSGVVFLAFTIYFDHYLVYVPDGIRAYEYELIDYLEKNKISYKIEYRFDESFVDKTVIDQNQRDRRINPKDRVDLIVCDYRLKPVDFGDKKLEAYLKTKYNLEEIRIKDVDQIQILNLSGLSLSSLKGIEYFQSLISIDLSANSLEYVPELIELDGLEALYLSHNMIKDTSFIEQMDSLIYLDLSNNEIIVERLEIKSTSLEQLVLDNNFIRNMTFMSNMPQLKKLSLSNNYIESIGDMSNSLGLKIIDLSKNYIVKIDNLILLKDLIILDLSHNLIEDVNSLKDSFALRSLDLSYNTIDSSDEVVQFLDENLDVFFDGGNE